MEINSNNTDVQQYIDLSGKVQVKQMLLTMSVLH